MPRVEACADAAIALACAASERSHKRAPLVGVRDVCTSEDIIAMKHRLALNPLVVLEWPRIKRVENQLRRRVELCDASRNARFLGATAEEQKEKPCTRAAHEV